MGFLDNLESDLKNLESATEREDPESAKHRRDSDRANRIALQPWVEKLRKSAFTHRLLRGAHEASFRIRARISVVWIGDTLRLDLPGKRLELRPTPNGVLAVEMRNGVAGEPAPVDFEGDPEAILNGWLAKTAD